MTPYPAPGRGARIRQAAATFVVAVLAVATAACATHTFSRGDPQALQGVPDDSLDSYIARVLAVSSHATARPATAAEPIEQTDPALSRALTLVITEPTGANYRHVGIEYRRLGIQDLAYRYFSRAIEKDHKDAAAFDMRARIWRDWGFPILGYADAYQAIKLAPHSPAAANTLGTLFEAAGNPGAARVWYEKAISLDADAPYALNNLCYLSVMRAERDAVAACERALAAAPDSVDAHNNLALAYAAGDEYDSARTQFSAAQDAAASHYNMGIVFMARRNYAMALEEFTRALRLNPALVQAADRARQARIALGTR